MRLLGKSSIILLASIIHLGSLRLYDPTNDLTEDDFLSQFGLPKLKNPKIKAQRAMALKQHEDIIKRQNRQYENGVKSWWDKLNDFADIPDDEAVKEKTGLKVKRQRRSKQRKSKRKRKRNYGRGLIPHNFTDDRSEKYFDQFRYNRARVPRSYSAVDEGIVSPIKNQKQCGSCVAFATVATIETCFKKITGVFGDYSEQELVDCGYNKNYAYGCNGAQCYSYTKWMVDNERELMKEEDYPYLNRRPKLRCPRTKPFRQGAKVTDTFYTGEGDEEMLKKLVYEHGAVLIAVNADSGFMYYGGGILSGCRGNGKYDCNHAVAAVGYGTENGEDYWLIKNSWGDWWGDKGYIKLKRGVNACGIGWYINTVTCESTNGPTDRPKTTDRSKTTDWRRTTDRPEPTDPEPTDESCYDEYDECPEYARTNCHFYGAYCKRSCGLCAGMTPHETNTCPDYWPSCKTYFSQYCHIDSYAQNCCLSCKGKETCKDHWGEHCPNRREEFCSNQEYKQYCKKTCRLC